jgi:hypothetical protein
MACRRLGKSGSLLKHELHQLLDHTWSWQPVAQRSAALTGWWSGSSAMAIPKDSPFAYSWLGRCTQNFSFQNVY